MARRQAEEVDLRGLLSEVKVDAKYTKFRNIVKAVHDRLNLDADRKEAFALHASRTSRTLRSKKQYSPKALMDAALTDLSARARLVEIRVKASYHLGLLDDAMNAMRRHLVTQYNDEISKYSNEAQRNALIQRVQGTALDLAEEGKEFMAMLDTIIKDIDQAGFSLRTMTECLKLLDGSKGRVL
jgi:hypothetical protein